MTPCWCVFTVFSVHFHASEESIEMSLGRTTALTAITYKLLLKLTVRVLWVSVCCSIDEKLNAQDPERICSLKSRKRNNLQKIVNLQQPAPCPVIEEQFEGIVGNVQLVTSNKHFVNDAYVNQCFQF